MARTDTEDYTYRQAGFSAFMKRSIDMGSSEAATLSQYARNAQQTTRAVNFDNTPLSGAMPDVVRIGTSVNIDGSKGRISINDENGNETVRIGELED